MKKVFVTGAGGFIGGHLIQRLLREKCNIRALVRSRVSRHQWSSEIEVFDGDILDKKRMRNAVSGCDTIFHLAGKVHDLSEKGGNDESHRTVNIGGTRNVLEGAVAAGISRFIFFSSVKAMGEGGDRCLDESAEPEPVTPYGKSKLAAEKLVHEYGCRFGIHTVCLRFPLIYGPGVKGNLQRMMVRIESGIFPPLPEFGNKRSLIHYHDAIQAAVLAASKTEAAGKTYIVTDGRAYSSRELYVLMCRVAGKAIPNWTLPISFFRALGRLGDFGRAVFGVRMGFDSEALGKLASSAWYSSEKISRELGFNPAFSFERGQVEMGKGTNGVVE